MQTKLKGKKVLVTGCAGFIPSYVAEYLVREGACVYGVDNLSTGLPENMITFAKKRNFRFYHDDVLNEKLMTRLVKQVDYVYHGAISGIGGSVQEPISELKVNTESTLSLLEAMRRHPPKRFIYPSSASVYGNATTMPEKEDILTNPSSPYGVSKLASERYCIVYHHVHKLPVVCLRYFNTYGPRQRRDSVYGGVVSIFINQALRSKPLTIYGTGNQTRDFTYIEDTLAATMAAFSAKDVEGQVINISAGKEYTVKELAHKIIKLTGKKSLKPIFVKERLVDNIQRRYGDIQKAAKLLDYHPTTSLDDGLRHTYDWNKKTYFPD